MEECRLPQRLFCSGFEPAGRNRVNNYFNLRWIENIKKALDADHLEQLASSQFGRLLGMGKHTFYVMFVHYLLSRQLVTKRKYELWWVLAGKPIRYAIEDFSLVTGLKCSKDGFKLDKRKGKVVKKGCSSASPMWKSLFGSEPKPTVTWILQKLLLGKKYKDADTRFRLALLLLVDGILCPTCGNTNISPIHVETVGDTDTFLKYPWGRDSFLKTVMSAKARTVKQLAKDTCAIQGFSHALVLVKVASCPSIIQGPPVGINVHDPTTTIEDIVQTVVERSLTINVQSARLLDQTGQASVCSMLSNSMSDNVGLSFSDEEDDEEVSCLVELVLDDHPFEHNSWSGGVDVAAVIDVGDESASKDDDSDGDNVCTVEVPSKEAGIKTKGCTELCRCHSGDVAKLIEVAAGAFEARILRLHEANNVELKTYIAAEISKLEKRFPSISKERTEWAPSAANLSGGAGGSSYVNATENGSRYAENESEDQSTPPKVPATTISDVEPPTFSIRLTQLENELRLPASNEPSTTKSCDAVERNAPIFIVDLTQEGFTVGRRRSARKGKNAVKNLRRPTRIGLHSRSSVPIAPVGETKPKNHESDSPEVPAYSKKNGRKRTRSSQQSSNDMPSKVSKLSSPMLLVGGFDAFTPPNEQKDQGFLKIMERARSYELSCGILVNNTEFLNIYDSSAFLDELGADLLIRFIQSLRDVSPNQHCDFLPASFLSTLYRQYSRFVIAPNKVNFSFSSYSAEPFLMRPKWLKDVDILYSPMQIERQHWIGLVIDLKAWQVLVLNCNRSCLSDQQINTYVEHIAVMLPYLIRKFVVNAEASNLGLDRMAVLRPSLPFQCSSKALVGIALLLLLELHIVSSLATYYRQLDVEKVQIAAKQYALGAFEAFSPSLVHL